MATVLSDGGAAADGLAIDISQIPHRGAVFTIHATRDERSIVTHRIIPDVAVAQARTLSDAGWRVRISGLGGRQFAPSQFHQLLTYDRIG